MSLKAALNVRKHPETVKVHLPSDEFQEQRHEVEALV